MALPRKEERAAELRYIQYQHTLEAQYLPAIRSLISKDLSEPYSIYVYRYFLCQWAHLCFMVSQLSFGTLNPKYISGSALNLLTYAELRL